MTQQLLIDPDIALMAKHFTNADERAWSCTDVEDWLESVGIHRQDDGQWLGDPEDIYYLVDSTEIRHMQSICGSSHISSLHSTETVN